jgi:hypothetical protein
MLNALKRYEIQLLVAVGHTHAEVARLAGVNERTVRRVLQEPPVMITASVLEDRSRTVGRPSVVEPYRAFVQEIVQQEPDLLSVEVLRRAKAAGYRGGKTALYELIASVRPVTTEVEMRFEGLPGEFSQHDFGEIDASDVARRRRPLKISDAPLIRPPPVFTAYTSRSVVITRPAPPQQPSEKPLPRERCGSRLRISAWPAAPTFRRRRLRHILSFAPPRETA